MTLQRWFRQVFALSRVELTIATSLVINLITVKAFNWEGQT